MTSDGRIFFNSTVRLMKEPESGSNSRGRVMFGGASLTAWAAGTALTAVSPASTMAMPFSARTVSSNCRA